MITKEQAMTAREFHRGECICHVGPRGGKTVLCIRYRRNGKTQTWKTRPDEFRIPVKYGFRECAEITDRNACLYHAAEDCPLNRVMEV